MTQTKVPTISLAKQSTKMDARSPSASDGLHSALKDIGFAYIKDHGIAESLIDSIFEFSKNFFAETQDIKNNIHMKNSGLHWRGYFPVGGELTSGRPDQKEGLYFGTEHGPRHPGVIGQWPLHGSNLWPNGARYKNAPQLINSYMSQMTNLGHKLMTLIAHGLGIEENYFQQRFTADPTTLFRIFNYPKHQWSDSADEWGVREHTDMGFLTILCQDSSGGLQVKDRANNWIDAPPVPGTFIINIGDMLELWTGGIYRATPHRVRNLADGDRLSLPFFFDPNWTATLEPIPRNLLRPSDLESVSSSVASRWDQLDINNLPATQTYGEFVWKKVANVFPDLSKNDH